MANIQNCASKIIFVFEFSCSVFRVIWNLDFTYGQEKTAQPNVINLFINDHETLEVVDQKSHFNYGQDSWGLHLNGMTYIAQS